jgi:hypothetical protein
VADDNNFPQALRVYIAGQDQALSMLLGFCTCGILFPKDGKLLFYWNSGMME